MSNKAPYSSITGPNGHLANCRQFDGNTMSAMWVQHADLTVYKVYSYNTAIASYDQHTGIWFEDRKYSVTTSKHQGYTRAWLARNLIVANHFPSVELASLPAPLPARPRRRRANPWISGASRNHTMTSNDPFLVKADEVRQSAVEEMRKWQEYKQKKNGLA